MRKMAYLTAILNINEWLQTNEQHQSSQCMRALVCLSLLCKHPADAGEELAEGDTCEDVNL